MDQDWPSLAMAWSILVSTCTINYSSFASIKLHLFVVGGLKHLERLSVSHCHYLYDDGLAYLSCVKKSLKFLDLSYCSSLSSKALVNSLSTLK